jgi:DNA-binding NarL/FixJ family response regulator
MITAARPTDRLLETVVRPFTILIVDDQEAIRRGVPSLLSSSEWIVCGEVCDGLEVVDKARSIRPNLVIMDILMLDWMG